jgi:flagellar basal-body rod protein FlgC
MTFDALGIARTGMHAHRRWLDAVSDNLANMNNAASSSAETFKAEYVQVRAAQGTEGVRVASVAQSASEGRQVYEPDNPIADDEGYVWYPDVDLGAQMGFLMMAQRGYQANAAVVERARTSYEAALQIGRG